MDPQTDSSTTAVPSFTELNDLASEAVGGKIVFATDDWFASAENLLKSTDPEWREGVFTEFGKWMDGWESRRKRIPGHDWCIIKLGAPGVIHGLDVDTSYFTGNYTPRCSIQAASLSQDLPARSGENRMGTKASEEELQSASKLRSQEWAEILPMTPLKPGYKSTCHSYFKVNSRERWTHLRLNMFPDGGIARLRVYGKVKPDWSLVSDSQEIDLAAMLNGGISVGYSDNHYGHARNVINPGRARIMAEGWETARRMDRPAVLEADEQGVLKVPGHEWAEFKLGHPGIIHKIELDTNHFKGNFPDSCYIEACCDPGSEGKARGPWKLLLPVKKMTAHKRHFYSGNEVNRIGVITHVKMTIAPDGGISRMRLWGHKAKVISAKM